MTKKILEKLERGCGKYPCGNRHTLPNGTKLILCPDCKARLSQHLESTKAERERVLKIIDNRFDGHKCLERWEWEELRKKITLTEEEKA
jgi:hypothetical protein